MKNLKIAFLTIIMILAGFSLSSAFSIESFAQITLFTISEPISMTLIGVAMIGAGQYCKSSKS